MKYSIWLVPPDPAFSQIQKIIDGLASEYHSFSFRPHITIDGMVDQEIDLIATQLKEVAKNTGPLSISLGPISFSTTFFTAVFVRVASTADLLQLYLNVKNVLNQEVKAYMPHLSLIYGHHNMPTREKIAREVKIPALQFTIKEMEIIPEKPNAREWNPVAVIPLKH